MTGVQTCDLQKDHGVVLALVADHHRVGDAGEELLELVLDGHGRDVLILVF